MPVGTQRPVLLVGGSGVVGSRAAKALRRLHPDLPLVIGGRDLARASATAEAVGRADAARVDLDRADLGLPEGRAYGAVVMFARDEGLRALRHAQAAGVPYVDVATGSFEVGPLAAQYVAKPAAAPVVLASHWLAGAAVLPTLAFARAFRRVDTIEIGVVLDEADMGGPAAYADYERITQVAPNPLIFKDGAWLWAGEADATRPLVDSGGATFQGKAYGSLDVVSLAASLEARSIRFDFAIGQTASRRRGGAFSTEIIVEIAGERHDGAAGRVRHELVHPEGQAPVTALGAALIVERLLGLAGGAPAGPGLYLPEVLIDPDYMLARLADFGMQIRKA